MEIKIQHLQLSLKAMCLWDIWSGVCCIVFIITAPLMAKTDFSQFDGTAFAGLANTLKMSLDLCISNYPFVCIILGWTAYKQILSGSLGIIATKELT